MSVLSDAQVAGYAKGANFTGSEVPIAVAIAHAESGCRTDVSHPNADGSIDYGLMQINSVHSELLASGNWQNPADNMRMAHMIYIQAGGWSPWATFNSGAYLTHMPAGLAASGAPPLHTGGGGGATITPAGNIVSDAVGGTVDGITAFVHLVTSPRTYLRAGEFLAGLILIMIAVIGLSRLKGLAKTSVKVAAL